MKVIKDILQILLLIVLSILLSILIILGLHIVAYGSAWLFGIESELEALFIIGILVSILITTYIILSMITSVKFGKSIYYTSMYWFIHPLVIRPYRGIKYIFKKKEYKVNYVDIASNSAAMLDNKKMNNSIHRLNYLNFMKKSMVINNKVLYSINLKQKVIMDSFPENGMIIDHKYRAKLNEVQGVEDTFENRRKFLNDDFANYKYKKENSALHITLTLLMLTSLSFVGIFAFLLSSALVAASSTVLMIGALVSLTMFIILLTIFSISEYKSIINSKIIVNKKGMDRLKANILYNITNLNELHNSLNGMVLKDLETVNRYISTTTKDDGIIEMFETFIEKFGTDILKEKIKSIPDEENKDDEYIKTKEKLRIKNESQKLRKNIKQRIGEK